MSDSTEKVDPCPFCGGESVLRGTTKAGLYVACKACAAEGPMGDDKTAIKLWNKRHANTAG